MERFGVSARPLDGHIELYDWCSAVISAIMSL